MNVDKIMTKNVAVAHPEDSIAKAAKQMKENCIGFLPVCLQNKLVGVVTDRDLVLRGLAHEETNPTTVEQVMSTDVITAGKNLSIEDACKYMSQHQIRRLPIIENKELIGILSLGDVALHPCYQVCALEALKDISKPGGNM